MQWFPVNARLGRSCHASARRPESPNVVGTEMGFSAKAAGGYKARRDSFLRSLQGAAPSTRNCSGSMRISDRRDSVHRKWPFNERPLSLTYCLKKLALHEATDNAEASERAAQQHRSRSAIWNSWRILTGEQTRRRDAAVSTVAVTLLRAAPTPSCRCAAVSTRQQ